MSSINLIDSMQWRYATKEFDSAKKVSDTDLDEIFECLRLTPSSFGLQPWKFVVVTDKAIRSKIREASWNQEQVTDASHLIVLCSKLDMTPLDIEKFVSLCEHERGLDAGTLNNYKDMMLGFERNMSMDQKKSWMQHQVYIALGNLLTACAVKGIDTCPMEGFDNDKVNEILNLEAYGIESTVMCTLGYRSDSDKYAHAKKVRYSKDEVFVFI